MARSSTRTIQDLTQQDYKYGFVTDIEAETVPRGLSEDIVRAISLKKNEPEFMLEWRLKAFRHWLTMQEPTWANVRYPKIDYQNIIYYSAPKVKKQLGSLDEVDPELLKTYEKLGIPLGEQKMLAGVAVDAVFDSVSVATTFKEKLRELGIIFCSFSEAVLEHPDLVKQYLGTVVPHNDNFFAALNSAVFSDGSFAYIPKGVRCPMELSTYFRINAADTSCTRRWSSWWRSRTRRSSTPPCRTGTQATGKGRAASTTSSPSAANAWGRARRSPGPRSRPARRSPGSTRPASCRGTTRSASSTRWP